MNSDSGRHDLLNGVVSNYNRSGNPGTFRVLAEAHGRYAIVPVTGSPLNANVALSASASTVADAVNALASEVSRNSGAKVVVGLYPVGPISQAEYRDDGQTGAARTKLSAILDAAPVSLVYQLLYDADSNQYYLNYFVARQAAIGPTGARVLKPLTHTPR